MLAPIPASSRPAPPFETAARTMLAQVNSALPHIGPEDSVSLAQIGLEQLSRMPSGNLKRLGSIASRALAAAGTGPLAAAIAITALKELHQNPTASPAQFGYRLMGPVQKHARQGERPEKELRAVAESIFGSVAPAYSIHPDAAWAVGEGDLMVRTPDVRATLEDRLNSVSRAMGKLSNFPDDLELLEESLRGNGRAGKLGDHLIVGGEIQRQRAAREAEPPAPEPQSGCPG